LLLFIGGICENIARKDLFDSKRGKGDSLDDVREKIRELEESVKDNENQEKKEQEKVEKKDKDEEVKKEKDEEDMKNQ